MRWIFLTVLAINIAILAYGQWLRFDGGSARNVTQSTPQEPKLDSVPSLVLLSEVAAQKQPVESIRVIKDVGQDVGAIENSDVVPISRSLCTLVGSFSGQAEAEYFVRRLNGLGVKAKVKNLLVSTTVGYWLHLPPLSSRKELLRRLSELQRQGVDSYVIPDGELENGISLGMFSERQRAELLQKNISQLGYSPQIAKVPREKRELWVFLLQEESIKINAESWFKLLSGKELLQKQQNLCSDVASA